MSTTTAEQNMETTTPSLEDVRDWTGDLEGARARLAEAEAAEAELRGQIGAAAAAGKDAAGLQADLREAAQEREAQEAAVEHLEERIREGRPAALQELARGRLQTIKKKAGGLVGEYARKVERLEEARERFLELAHDVKATPEHLKALRLEAQILGLPFDLPVPNLRTLPQDVAKRANRAAAVARPPEVGRESMWMAVSSKLRSGDYMAAARSLAHIVAQLFEGEESPTPELLEEADSGEAQP